MREGMEYQTAPYNLVFAPEWMLLVPRSRDGFDGISVNSLAYAGSFFVRDESQFEAVTNAQPMAILRSVAYP